MQVRMDDGYIRHKLADGLAAQHWLYQEIGAHVPTELRCYVGAPCEDNAREYLRSQAEQTFRLILIGFSSLCDMLEVLDSGDERALIVRLLTGTREQLREWTEQMEGDALDRERQRDGAP